MDSSASVTARAVPARRAAERCGPAMVLAIVLMALNLRPVFAGLPPLIAGVRADLGLSAAAAGLLTTLPVLCLGVFAPLAPRLAVRFPIERLLVACAVTTAAGAALRGTGGTAGLVAGGVLAGSAIAISQAVLPMLVRVRFPDQAGMLTGAFSMAITLGGTLAAGAAVPLERALGDQWEASLAFWAVPAALAAAVWMPQAVRVGTVTPRGGGAPLLRSGLAWAVGLYFGLQSMGFYSTLSWLPSILEDVGHSPEAAGGLLGLSMLMQVAPAFVVPLLAHRSRHQLWLLLAIVGSVLAGLGGLLAAPGAALLWVVLIGVGQGGMLGLAMMLPLLRGGEPRTVASLTGMALGVGYVVASVGPWVVGAAHDVTGGWTAPLVVLMAITAAELVPGVPAVLDRTLATGGH